MKKTALVRKSEQRDRGTIWDRKRIHLSCSASWELITLYVFRLSAVSLFFFSLPSDGKMGWKKLPLSFVILRSTWIVRLLVQAVPPR